MRRGVWGVLVGVGAGILLSAVSLYAETARQEVAATNAAGQTWCRMIDQGGEYRFVDEQQRVLGEAKIREDRVKLRDAQGKDHWTIKRKDYGAEIEDGGGTRLYRIRQDGDGWKLEDAGKRLVARAKHKGSDVELRDGGGKTIAKAKARAKGVRLETEEGSQLGGLEGLTDARVAVWFALDRFSCAERGAMAAYFLRVGR